MKKGAEPQRPSSGLTTIEPVGVDSSTTEDLATEASSMWRPLTIFESPIRISHSLSFPPSARIVLGKTSDGLWRPLEALSSFPSPSLPPLSSSLSSPSLREMIWMLEPSQFPIGLARYGMYRMVRHDFENPDTTKY